MKKKKKALKVMVVASAAVCLALSLIKDKTNNSK